VKLYEAMFLVDSSKAAADWTGIEDAVKHIMERVEGEIVSMRKWDERRLAYEIKGCSRGTYILCYFKVDGERIRDIERDVQLSEQFMRVLILSAEGREADADKETPSTKAEREIQESRATAEAATAATAATAAAAAKAEAAEAGEEAAAEVGAEATVEVSELSEAPEASESVDEAEGTKVEAGESEASEAGDGEEAEAEPVAAEVEPEQGDEETKQPSGDEEVSP
jgi:small subunit ribosomal protein S6